MVERVLLSVLSLILCVPLVHVAQEKLRPDLKIDHGTPEWKAREALIARAKVFVNPDRPISTLDLSRPPNDPRPLDPASVVDCRYVPKPIKATTPKFDCELPNGDVIKVKYGRTPERPGEAAATRLLAALGFGADHVTILPKVRCRGCPLFPFQMRRLAELFYAVPLLEKTTNSNAEREFTWVAAERKMAGRSIEVGVHEGWDWRELPLVDPAKGGATRAELDALRLTAILLGHWDNKASNQRLVCEDGPGENDASAPCRTPVLILQDVGATFGPTKVEHEQWAAMPIWADEARCVVSLQQMPYHGGNFTPIQISEAGRALLAGRITQLSESQLRAMFESSRFPDPATGDAPGDITAWVRTFQEKVRQIARRQPCPSLAN